MYANAHAVRIVKDVTNLVWRIVVDQRGLLEPRGDGIVWLSHPQLTRGAVWED